MSSMMDMITAGIFFIIFCLCGIVGLMIFNSLSSSTSLIPTNIASGGRDFFTALNNVALFIMIGMTLGAVMSAYMIKTNPAYIIIPIAFIFIQVVVIIPLVNSFNTITASSTMSAAAASMSNMTDLVNMMPVFSILGSLLAALVGLTRD